LLTVRRLKTRLMPRRDRIPGVDLARGVALLGMVAVHVLPTTDDAGAPTLVESIAGGRSAALFAVVAGVGVALAFGPGPGGRSAAALAVRAGLIGLIGLALGLFDSGVAVILAYYAVLFVLVLPWLRAGRWTLLASAGLVAVVVPFLSQRVRDDLPPRDTSSPSFIDLQDPGQLAAELLLTGYYPAAAWVAYLLVGLAVGRLALHSRRTAVRLVLAGALAALTAHVTSAVLLGPLGGYDRLTGVVRPAEGQTVRDVVDASRFGNVPTDSPWWLATDAPHTTTPLDLLATAGAAVAVLGLCLLLRTRLLAPLAAAGSMPLTLYSAHVLLLAATDTSSPVRYYLVQVGLALLLATLWRRQVGRGPLERAVAAAVRPVAGGRT
jgi:uncharacterized membrane protein